MKTDPDQVLEALSSLGPVTPEQRARLRSAVARLELIDDQERWHGPSEGPRPWLTVSDVAEAFRIDRQTIQAMCRTGAFGPGAAFQLSNRKGSEWRIRRSAVEAWIRTQLTSGGAA